MSIEKIPPEKWPSLSDRIKNLDSGERVLGPNDKVTYTWAYGYETLDVHHDDTNSGIHHAGSFHPRDGLCVGNPCDYCGHTTVDPEDFA